MRQTPTGIGALLGMPIRRPPPASRAPFPTRKRHFGQIDNVKGVFSPSTLSIGGAKRLAADADRNRGVTGNANPAPSPGVACTFSHPQATFWPNLQGGRSFFSFYLVDRGNEKRPAAGACRNRGTLPGMRPQAAPSNPRSGPCAPTSQPHICFCRRECLNRRILGVYKQKEF